MINREILRKYSWVIPIILTAFFTFLYLGNKSIWLDEAYTILFVKLSWSELWSLLTTKEANMGIYYVMLKLWVGVFGDSEFAVRSLSAIFSILTVGIVSHIGARIFNFKSGFIAGILLSLNSFYIEYAQEARGYSLLLLVIVISFYFFLKSIEKKNYRYFLALGFTNGLIVYAHFFGFFIILSQACTLFFIPRKEFQWKMIVGSIFITTTMVIPLGLFILSTKADQLDWVEKASWKEIIFTIKFLVGGSYNNGNILLSIYFISCFNYIIYIIKRCLKNNNERKSIWKIILLLFWFIFPIFCLYLISIIKPSFIHRYMIASLPAIALIAGVGIASFKSKINQGLLITILVLASLYNLFVNYYPNKKSEWNVATQHILKYAQVNDTILFYSQVAQFPFEYYYNKFNYKTDFLKCIWPRPFGTKFNSSMLSKIDGPSRSEIDNKTGTHQRIWVVLAYDNIKSLRWNSKPIVDWIENKYKKLDEIEFKGIKILQYEMTSKNEQTVRGCLHKFWKTCWTG